MIANYSTLVLASVVIERLCCYGRLVGWSACMSACLPVNGILA